MFIFRPQLGTGWGLGRGLSFWIGMGGREGTHGKDFIEQFKLDFNDVK